MVLYHGCDAAFHPLSSPRSVLNFVEVQASLPIVCAYRKHLFELSFCSDDARHDFDMVLHGMAWHDIALRI